jgi:hypothetical protein
MIRSHKQSYHLHNALVREGIFLILKLQVPSFLSMDPWILDCPRMINSVGVNIDEIVKILGILTGHDVARPIWIGKGIQKCLKTSLEELDKWILGLIFSTAAENRVFEDMRNSS